jgi:hypothetical protein
MLQPSTCRAITYKPAIVLLVEEEPASSSIDCIIINTHLRTSYALIPQMLLFIFDPFNCVTSLSDRMEESRFKP